MKEVNNEEIENKLKLDFSKNVSWGEKAECGSSEVLTMETT